MSVASVMTWLETRTSQLARLCSAPAGHPAPVSTSSTSSSNTPCPPPKADGWGGAAALGCTWRFGAMASVSGAAAVAAGTLAAMAVSARGGAGDKGHNVSPS